MSANLKNDQTERSENDPEPAAAAPAETIPPPRDHPNDPSVPVAMPNSRHMLNVGAGTINDTPFGLGEQINAGFRTITRELLIKFLKLEKFHLQKMKKKLVTVNDLLEDFITQNDLDRKYAFNSYIINLIEFYICFFFYKVSFLKYGASISDILVNYSSIIIPKLLTISWKKSLQHRWLTAVGYSY